MSRPLPPIQSIQSNTEAGPVAGRGALAALLGHRPARAVFLVLWPSDIAVRAARLVITKRSHDGSVPHANRVVGTPL